MLLFNFEGACPLRKAKEKTERTLRWGCSSVGRAPALQAGGHGFESHHLHRSCKQRFKLMMEPCESSKAS